MKKIILLFTTFLLTYSINAQSISISGSTSGTRNSTIKYTCDISYRLHKFATYSERPQGIRFGIKNFKIVDVSYNGINASEIANISLPKSCGKVIGVLSGDFTISQGNSTLSGTFHQSSIGSGTDFTDNFDFSSSTNSSIASTFGKDIDANNLNLRISNVKYSDNNGSASNCSSSIVNEIYSFSNKKEQIIKLKDKISIYGSTKKDLLKKQSLFKQLASIDKTNNYQNELEELEEEMRTLAKKELKNEEKSTESVTSVGLTVETKKEGSKEKKSKKEKDDYEKIKKEEEKKKNDVSEAVARRMNYEKYVKELKQLRATGKTSTQRYKNLLGLVEGYEVLTNRPLDKRVGYNMTGIRNRALAGTSSTSKSETDAYNEVLEAQENVAKVKAKYNKIGEQLSSTLGNVFGGIANARDRKRDEERRKSKIKYAKIKLKKAKEKAKYIKNLKEKRNLRKYRFSLMNFEEKKQEYNLYKEILENPSNDVFKKYLNKFILRKEEVSLLFEIFKDESIEFKFVRPPRHASWWHDKIRTIPDLDYSKRYITRLTVDVYSKYYKIFRGTKEIRSISSNDVKYLKPNYLKNLKKINLEMYSINNIEILYQLESLEWIYINSASGDLNLLGGIKNLKEIHISHIQSGLSLSLREGEYSLKNLNNLKYLGIFSYKREHKKKLKLLKKNLKPIIKEFKRKNKDFDYYFRIKSRN